MAKIFYNITAESFNITKIYCKLLSIKKSFLCAETGK